MTDIGKVEAAPGIVLQFLSGREGGTATSVVSRDTGLEVRMSIAGDERKFALVIPRPALGQDQSWLSMDPQDLEDWAAMLGTWIDEEICAGAAQWVKLTAEGELHYFHPAPTT